jgi:arsenate reductase-like glutaredoxin family protein
LTDSKAVQLALDHPSLIRRPLIEHGDGTVTVGFSDKVRKAIGG